MRKIVGKYVLPQVFAYNGMKLLTFAKNSMVMTIHINGNVRDTPPFVCTVFDVNCRSKTRSFSGDILDITSQFKIEILLEKYFLIKGALI
jgi:hypothetical protein